MIFINPKLATYNQYQGAQRSNDMRLKEVMEKVIVDESPEQMEPKKYGKGVAPVHRREMPVVYVNKSKAKKPKTFKL